MTPDFSSLQDAVVALTGAVAEAADLDARPDTTQRLRDVVHAGVVQHFEFTYELAWRSMRRALVAELGEADLDGVQRFDVFRLAAARGWVDDVAAWIDFNAARNMTSHGYDRDIVERIYLTSVDFLRHVRRLAEHLTRAQG